MSNKTMGSQLLDKGYELQETYQDILEQRGANRRTLRDLDAQGMLTPEESQATLELYPPKRSKSDEEQAE